MSEKQPAWVELARYPLLVLSLFLAAWASKCALDLDFGRLESVGAEGLRFRTEEAQTQSLVEIETRLNELRAAVDSLQTTGARPEEATAPTLDAATQTVSDQTARVTELREEARPADVREGFVFIGNYGPEGWDRAMLLRTGAEDGPVTRPPDQLRVGEEFVLRGNMVLRGGPPPNNEQYYRAVPSLGVIPRGTRVELLGEPVGIDREFAVQYWARVRPLRSAEARRTP